MASLPPRPQLPQRDDRRPSPSERDRDRRPAQPMAPRYRAPPPPDKDRDRDRDRTYIPPPPSRPRQETDTYIPPGYDNRRDGGVRRDYDDRDRDRDRRDYDRDRDRRNWGGRDRDWGRDRTPPRRRDSLERDRRPYDRDRGPPRRLSPIRRGPYRRSRSPRRHSRSPPPRGRYRSRSPLRSPSPKRIRLGNHSIEASPRSRSPFKRRHSKDRSRSPRNHPPPPHMSTPPERCSHRHMSPHHSPQRMRPEGNQPPPEEGQITAEDKPVSPVPEDSKQSSDHPAMEVEKIPEVQKLEASNALSPKRKPPPATLETQLAHVDPPKQALGSPIPPPKKEEPEVKMVVDAPALTAPLTSHPVPNRARSPSPQTSRTSTTADFSRGPPIAPRAWANRSPPRAPRSHPRGGPPSHAQSSYLSAPRGGGGRRNYPPSGQRSFHPSSTAKPKPDGPTPRLPTIPQYDGVKLWADLEKDLARLQSHRMNLANEHLQQMKGLHRALHELDLSTIDLHAAESRRRVAESQLEKAKTGSLGIDYTELVEPQSV